MSSCVNVCTTPVPVPRIPSADVQLCWRQESAACDVTRQVSKQNGNTADKWQTPLYIIRVLALFSYALLLSLFFPMINIDILDKYPINNWNCEWKTDQWRHDENLWSMAYPITYSSTCYCYWKQVFPQNKMSWQSNLVITYNTMFKCSFRTGTMYYTLYYTVEPSSE